MANNPVHSLRSMTGFGRGSASSASFQVTVELSSVNRKQAEVAIQAPRELAELEPRIRKALLARIDRGRVQTLIRLERPEGAPVPARVDSALARALEDAFAELSEAVGRPIRPEATDFLRHPGIVSLEEPDLDLEAVWAVLAPALDQAATALVAMRAAEGADLARDLSARIDALETHLARVASAAPKVPARQKTLLFNRLREAGLDLDPADERVLKEIALFAERCDISEELTRLRAHIQRFRAYLASGKPVGRPLDFLCQEIHREWNTIGAKANDPAIAQTVVEAKTELEKIREQSQNVE